MPKLITASLKHLKDKRVNNALLNAVALSGAVLWSWFFHDDSISIPMLLGIIAAALSESDGGFLQRLKSQTLTLLCFTFASLSVELLFHMKWAFIVCLLISTFGLTMLGALGDRYANIAFGSLMIAIYTMLGASDSTSLWSQPAAMTGGAIWYFIVSMIWHLFSPLRSVKHSLAEVFVNLSKYLSIKSSLFFPSADTNVEHLIVLESKRNTEIVSSLNDCKRGFLSRSKRGYNTLFSIYFIAQDIHERISSSHYKYHELAKEFVHHDVMFRFKYLVDAQAKACLDIAESIKCGKQYVHGQRFRNALLELKASLDDLQNNHTKSRTAALKHLHFLFRNLASIEKQLSNIHSPTKQVERPLLADDQAFGLKEATKKVTTHITKGSALFRHAVRLSVALTAGFSIIQISDMQQGYWILLTTLFVCQPNYGATLKKLVSRITGTFVGILTGVPLLILFPSPESQLAIVVASGIAFFAFRQTQYGVATCFITILVLFCFHQSGQGFDIILPRVTDTLVGSFLAVLVVTFILPDWQSKNLNTLIADAINANQMYLVQIIKQYRTGRVDSLSYRVTRRKAHEMDAALSIAMSNMALEPAKHRSDEANYQFLVLNHLLLSYISTLGAHRKKIEHKSTTLEIDKISEYIFQQLSQLQILFRSKKDSIETRKKSIVLNELWPNNSEREDENVRIIYYQLSLINQTLVEFYDLFVKKSDSDRQPI